MSLTADINGTDITGICQSIRWRHSLSRPATGIVRFPGYLFSVETGVSELHIYNNGGLVFSGLCAFPQSDGGPDSAYTEVTAYDHMVCLTKRLCKTAAGNLITPGTVITSEVTAPAILAAYINNAINDAKALTPPSAPLPLSVGSVASGGDDVSGVPTNFPMTIDEMRILLISTGQLDVIVNPGIGSSSVDLTNGDPGSDLSGSVSFEYGTGAHNAQIATFTEDMEVLINALWYLLGPRQPGGERWKGSITPTAANAGGDGQGGNATQFWPPELVAKFLGSRQIYGYMQEIRIFDDKGDEDDIRPLFEEEWANEAFIRAVPRQFATVKPDRGTPLSFFTGDLIHVAGGAMLNGGFSDNQRVYEFEVECDPDGVMEVTEILTSSDQEGA